MKTKLLVLAVLVFSLFLLSSTAHAYMQWQAGSSNFVFSGGFASGFVSPGFGNFKVFTAPTLPTTFRNGFTVVRGPAFVGSALHPATFGAYAMSRVVTVPAFSSWNGFRSAWW